MKHSEKLSIFWMNVLKLYVRLSLKQIVEYDKY